MKRLIPPLNSIKTFETVAKYMSFTKAAEEMGVTQSAVSKQIQILEEYLGIVLFNRSYKNLELTKSGSDYYYNIVKSFDIIESASHSVLNEDKHNNLLTINALPSITKNLIVPHIGDFKKKHPEINVNIITGNNDDNFCTNLNFSEINADIVMRASYRTFPGVANYLIFDEELVCVCSPDLLKIVEHKANSFEDIKKFPLIGDVIRYNIWEEWMSSVNINISDINKILAFDNFFLMIEAAKNAVGMAFIPKFLVEKELKDGELINFLNISYKTGYSYYLLYPKYKTFSHKVQLFIKWVDSLNL